MNEELEKVQESVNEETAVQNDGMPAASVVADATAEGFRKCDSGKTEKSQKEKDGRNTSGSTRRAVGRNAARRETFGAEKTSKAQKRSVYRRAAERGNRGGKGAERSHRSFRIAQNRPDPYGDDSRC